eukprot:gb/GEZN01011954.1/.p1 GENE.gb/GEZN01011954.1/~~gb/GEZN01011954.1/.p1  ORF type:complete len:126 (+),score=5.32 gb/GEZN01011954.1/:454-831(+)
MKAESCGVPLLQQHSIMAARMACAEYVIEIRIPGEVGTEIVEVQLRTKSECLLRSLRSQYLNTPKHGPCHLLFSPCIRQFRHFFMPSRPNLLLNPTKGKASSLTATGDTQNSAAKKKVRHACRHS